MESFFFSLVLAVGLTPQLLKFNELSSQWFRLLGVVYRRK